MRVILIEEKKLYKAGFETEEEKAAYELGILDAHKEMHGPNKQLSFAAQRLFYQFLTPEQKEIVDGWTKNSEEEVEE